MFEDLIKKRKIPQPVSKDSLIKAMKDNIADKEDMILELLDEINGKNIIIDDLTKELQYLKDL